MTKVSSSSRWTWVAGSSGSVPSIHVSANSFGCSLLAAAEIGIPPKLPAIRNATPMIRFNPNERAWDAIAFAPSSRTGDVLFADFTKGGVFLPKGAPLLSNQYLNRASMPKVRGLMTVCL
jgi:hypothetical protein